MSGSAKNKSETHAMHDKGYITVAHAAKAVKRHSSRIYAALDAEQVEGLRVGRARYVKWTSLVQHMTGGDATVARILGLDPKKIPAVRS